MATTVNLGEHYRGDTIQFGVTIRWSTGAVINIAGMTLEYIIQDDLGTQVSVTTPAEILIDDGPNGHCIVTVDETQTATLNPSSCLHQLRLTMGADLYTVMRGTVAILEDL